jgi:hypothetical protein
MADQSVKFLYETYSPPEVLRLPQYSRRRSAPMVSNALGAVGFRAARSSHYEVELDSKTYQVEVEAFHHDGRRGEPSF